MPHLKRGNCLNCKIKFYCVTGGLWLLFRLRNLHLNTFYTYSEYYWMMYNFKFFRYWSCICEKVLQLLIATRVEAHNSHCSFKLASRRRLFETSRSLSSVTCTSNDTQEIWIDLQTTSEKTHCSFRDVLHRFLVTSSSSFEVFVRSQSASKVIPITWFPRR